jgi:glycosyltransferase involved in cell wall biosynthesis
MRIGYLTYGLDRAPTGIGRYAVELLHALSKIPQGPEIVLLTTEREDRHGLWDQFEHHALPGCRLLPVLMSAGNLLLSQAEHRYRLDILHDPNGIAPFLGPKGRTKRIVTIHDAFTYIHPETHNTLDNWRYRWMLPEAARRADTVITVSECSKRDLRQYIGLGEEQVVITPEGVSPRFKPITDGVERREVLDRYGITQAYILYLGGINPRKNIRRLLEAFAQVREHCPKVTLVIAGKRQWQLEEIDATFERLNLHGQVHFTGYVDEADLPALYSAAELFVFPSLYEGFGLPPLEAMACGTPVIASKTSSLLEILNDAALTVDPYDVYDLAEAIKRVLTDQTLRSNLRVRGLERASHFTWQRTARETLQVYSQVKGANGTRAFRIDRPKKKTHAL